ncbi:hypothetical protein BB559_002189 [Furculomyces boomerangus]|uniref:Uncharacterized protein n=1 Tax=Furculomyces boomerangus TaxID=61424 RepID=A0A2T9YXA1_9FUNG|nr:hypothetical protein BB559_002189 [Furculomyces boomerangus]
MYINQQRTTSFSAYDIKINHYQSPLNTKKIKIAQNTIYKDEKNTDRENSDRPKYFINLSVPQGLSEISFDYKNPQSDRIENSSIVFRKSYHYYRNSKNIIGNSFQINKTQQNCLRRTKSMSHLEIYPKAKGTSNILHRKSRIPDNYFSRIKRSTLCENSDENEHCFNDRNLKRKIDVQSMSSKKSKTETNTKSIAGSSFESTTFSALKVPDNRQETKMSNSYGSKSMLTIERNPLMLEEYDSFRKTVGTSKVRGENHQENISDTSVQRISQSTYILKIEKILKKMKSLFKVSEKDMEFKIHQKDIVKNNETNTKNPPKPEKLKRNSIANTLVPQPLENSTKPKKDSTKKFRFSIALKNRLSFSLPQSKSSLNSASSKSTLMNSPESFPSSTKTKSQNLVENTKSTSFEIEQIEKLPNKQNSEQSYENKSSKKQIPNSKSSSEQNRKYGITDILKGSSSSVNTQNIPQRKIPKKNIITRDIHKPKKFEGKQNSSMGVYTHGSFSLLNINKTSSIYNPSLVSMGEKNGIEVYRQAAHRTKNVKVQLDYTKFLLDTILQIDHVVNEIKESCENDLGERKPNVGYEINSIINRNLMAAKSNFSSRASRISLHGINETDEYKLLDTSSYMKKEVIYWLNFLTKHKGNIEAYYILGTLYEHGKYGLEKNSKKAHKLYSHAAKYSHPDSTFKVATYFELHKNYQKSIAYYHLAASLFQPNANYRIGIMLLKGELNQKRNYKSALIYLRRSAEQADRDCPDGAYVLGLIYLGLYPDEELYNHLFIDCVEGCRLLEIASSLSMPDAQYKLGKFYESGDHGFPIDEETSIMYYQYAAEGGNSKAQYALSRLYLIKNGGLIGYNGEKAFEWCKRAAEKKCTDAEYKLGQLYELGIGTESNEEKALFWYKKAAKNNHTEAKLVLAEKKSLLTKKKRNTFFSILSRSNKPINS